MNDGTQHKGLRRMYNLSRLCKCCLRNLSGSARCPPQDLRSYAKKKCTISNSCESNYEWSSKNFYPFLGRFSSVKILAISLFEIDLFSHGDYSGEFILSAPICPRRVTCIESFGSEAAWLISRERKAKSLSRPFSVLSYT